MKCWICGDKATKTRNLKISQNLFGGYVWTKPVDTTKQRCYCSKCYKMVEKNIKEENELYIKLKKKRMMETALDNLEHQNINIYEYKEAIEAIQDYMLEKEDKFDSSYEVLAAIMLIQNRIQIKPQFKVGRYQADFCLPDYHIILEIDGERHKNRKYYDSKRDKEIKEILGTDWEIIRIPAELLDQNANRIKIAIEQVLKYRESKHINWRDI